MQASEGKPGTELVRGAPGARHSSIILSFILELNYNVTCWSSDCSNSFDTIYVAREFEGVNTRPRGAGGWRGRVVGPVQGSLWICLFCFLNGGCYLLWIHRRYYAEPVVNGIPYSVKGYRGSARLYSVQVSLVYSQSASKAGRMVGFYLPDGSR